MKNMYMYTDQGLRTSGSEVKQKEIGNASSLGEALALLEGGMKTRTVAHRPPIKISFGRDRIHLSQKKETDTINRNYSLLASASILSTREVLVARMTPSRLTADPCYDSPERKGPTCRWVSPLFKLIAI